MKTGKGGTDKKNGFQDEDFVYKQGVKKYGNFPEGRNEENKSSCGMKNNL